jgi:hypothetical protein
MLVFSSAIYGQWRELSHPQIKALESSTIYRGCVAHRKIESGASVGEGKQKAPNTEHGPNKVFQDGAVPVSNKGSFRTLFSRVFRAHHVPDSPLNPSTGNFGRPSVRSSPFWIFRSAALTNTPSALSRRGSRLPSTPRRKCRICSSATRAASAPPGAPQSDRQCHQVRRARPDSRCRCRRVPRPGPCVASFRRERHRNRHTVRHAGKNICGIFPGRWLNGPQVWRHRARPGHLRAARRDDGRPDLG